MKFEIEERKNDIQYTIPQVTFPAYEDYLQTAEDIAAYIRSMDVSSDNIKDIKKTLADARKLTDRLSRARIDIKKEILQSYVVFEGQVKTIAGVVDEADRELREKVKILEEAEREAKKEQLAGIWQKRVEIYPDIVKYIPDAFDKWLRPQHLNKSTTIKSAEADMTEWMENVDNNLNSASIMGEDYLYEYIRVMDLAEAINNVKDREKWMAEMSAEDIDELFEAVPMATFTVIGKKDIELAARLLTENEIAYERKDF